MVLPSKSAPGGIVWDFSIAEQGQVSRFGRLGPSYYKQFLPFGIELPDKHPPKRIDVRSYEIARRLSRGEAVRLGGK